MTWKRALAANAVPNTKRAMDTPLGRAFIASLLQEWGLFMPPAPGGEYSNGSKYVATWLWDRLGDIAPRERMLMLQEWLYQGDPEPQDKNEPEERDDG